jgi:hypothetical protein
VIQEAVQGVCCEGDSLVGVSVACLPQCQGEPAVFNGLHLELSPDWSNSNMPLPIPVHAGTDNRKPERTLVLVIFVLGTYQM